MTITLTFSKTAYFKAIFARLLQAISAAKRAFNTEIQNNVIYKPVNYSEFN